MRLIYALLVAGNPLSNSTVETVIASHELPANSLQPGKVYEVEAAVVATATNSTDTLNVRVRVGSTTLTGTIVGQSGAVDVVNADVVIVRLRFIVRNVGSASIVIVSGLISAPGAEATATARVAFESLSLDSAAAQKIEITGTWNVASASNSARCDVLNVFECV